MLSNYHHSLTNLNNLQSFLDLTFQRWISHTSLSFLIPFKLPIHYVFCCAWRAAALSHTRLAMSSVDVFMSSPPRARTSDSTCISSSSPFLPSLDEIFLKKSPKKLGLGAGSQAAPIPSNTRTTFTSAANVLREAPEIDIDTEAITNSPSRRTRPTTSRRRNASTPDALANDRNSTSSLSPKDKPWQKFKTKPSAKHGDQPLYPRGTKDSTSRNDPDKAPLVAEEQNVLCENGTERVKDKVRAKESIGAAISSIELEHAVPRRGDWTPPKANDPIVLDSDSDARELFSSAGKEPLSKDVFQTLYSQYGRQDVGPTSEPYSQPQAIHTDFLRKRKRIELVSIGQKEVNEQSLTELPPLRRESQGPREQKSTEPKASVPKKKTRTITELAIAPFAAPLASDIDLAGPPTRESMLDYFDSDGAVKALVEHQTAVMSQRKPKAKETKQPPKTKRKKKAGTETNPILLSPSTALKQSSNQDFVFGTSSQLVEEESPTTLRHIQAAIRASNSLNSDPFDDDVAQRLWHAGARDEDGELLEMEIVGLQHHPTIAANSNSTTTPGGRSFVDIDDILDSPQLVSSSPNRHSGSTQTNSLFFQPEAMKQNSSIKVSEPEGQANATNAEPRPNYELFTDAQLSKQVASYGFKLVKKRATMIALLDRCWASKHQGALAGSLQPLSTTTSNATPAQQESAGCVHNKAPARPRARGRPKKDDDTVARPSTPEKLSPKRPRGRSKKKETASTSVAEASTSVSTSKRPRGRPRKSSTTSMEIPDSENGTPSPISSPDPVFSSPPPLDLTTSDEGDMSLTLSPTDQQTELFKHITKAVTSTPRSQDPSKPSWYEKMLLYDPIILEDLASWLNGGELTRVGYDGEVSPFDVKKWCESKSVICLWRQNINGRERKRF
ncbi:hypothetical protein F5Y09DRAFT_322393 [Xylaria sp. FL1042]|nr:hypothetical protein F5Y09DRAFT_322393 [Xylaria sp. FL1042]